MGWKYYSIGFFVLSLLCLSGGVIAVWNDVGHVSIGAYKCFRGIAAFLVSIYAAVSVWRLASEALTNDLKSEVGGYLGFWVLIPPIWFFLEYFAAASNQIIGLESSVENLKQIKDFADYASKIWAAVVTFLTGLVALKKAA